MVDDSFGNWLAGFFDGEGCFSVIASERTVTRKGKDYLSHESNVTIAIALREDDADILRYIRDTVGCGKVSYRTRFIYHGSKPQMSWKVNRIEECRDIIIPLFTKYPLRAKKSREFPIWSRAVTIACEAKSNRFKGGRKRIGHMLNDEMWSEMKRLDAELKEIRRYKL